MRDNKEIHTCLWNELCGPEHGTCGHGCQLGCDTYDVRYDDIEAEWAIEGLKRINVNDYMPNQDTELQVWTKTDSFKAIHSSLRGDWVGVEGGVRFSGITHWSYIN